MAIELIVPPLGESITEAVVAKWLVPVGAAVSADQPLAELETDKVTVTLPAPAAGRLLAQLVQPGGSVRVGDSIGRLEPGAQAEAAIAQTPAPAPVVQAQIPPPAPVQVVQAQIPPPAPRPAGNPETRASQPALTPTGRKRLRELGQAHEHVPTQSAPLPQVQFLQTEANESEQIVPLSPLRKRIAERLVEAQHTAAILTTFNEVDLGQVLSLRSRFQDQFVKKHGLKLGLMSFFVRACVAALKEFPGLNAELRDDAVVYKKHYDFGIAVGGGKGLVVPVLRSVDRLSMAEIEKGIATLAQKAKDNKLELSDLAGGTFSISNGGVYGSMMSTPLLNMPQTGILGMHNIISRPVAVANAVEIRPMMYLALSYDHRVVDGREAVSFLVRVKERLEAPEKLLFDL